MFDRGIILRTIGVAEAKSVFEPRRKRELPVLPVVRPPPPGAIIKKERKAQETKAISSIPGKFW